MEDKKMYSIPHEIPAKNEGEKVSSFILWIKTKGGVEYQRDLKCTKEDMVKTSRLIMQELVSKENEWFFFEKDHYFFSLCLIRIEEVVSVQITEDFPV